jgi:sulfide dehydrogenase [flavocytochrome c] flavoprotein subunit
MPKSASAARSQARQCARSIVAALDGREPPEAELDSVCYSMLARDQALSIHARFRLADGVIHESPPADVAKPLDTPSAEAANAQAWYKSIVAESFGEPS